ncbi:hypothetical protein ACLB2K_035381 [Fragaria x ananassa]
MVAEGTDGIDLDHDGGFSGEEFRAGWRICEASWRWCNSKSDEEEEEEEEKWVGDQGRGGGGGGGVGFLV